LDTSTADRTTSTTATSTAATTPVETGKKISLPVLYDNVVLDYSKPSGLYGVECNYDKSVFATGTGDNSVIALYSVPEMAPYSVLKGHKDLVFCMDWFNGGGGGGCGGDGATRDVLVSGSRDTKVGVWKTPQKRKDSELELELVVVEPELLLDGHQCKVRAVKCSSSTAGNDVVSLGSNGLLNVWDLTQGCKKRESYQLVNGVDSLCMDVVNSNNNSANGLYAVGSQSSVSLLDFRMHKACLHVFESLDETFGVRSLKFSNVKSLLTVGGGLGRIGFYDLRQCKYIEQSNHGRSRLYLRSGSGWVVSLFCSIEGLCLG
jgi:WD repeat-containing protein 40A